MNPSSSSYIRSKSVLITGGTGFVGAYIIKALITKGFAVRALKRKTSVLPFFIPENILQKVEWVEGDVLDVYSLTEALQGAGSVVHAAAIVSFAKSERKKMYATNVQGTANVVNAALESGIQRLLHVSSVAALGRTGNGQWVSEEKQWQDDKHQTQYAISKHRAELEVWRGFAEGLEGVIMNPSTVLGYGNWHTSSCALFKNAYKEFPWYTRGINGFVGVEDVAEAACRLLLSSISGQRFIVSAENISFQQLFTLMAKGFDKKPPHKEAGKWMGALAWRMEAIKSLFTGKRSMLTKESAKVAHSQTYFNHEELLNALPGFDFTALDEVIEAACKQYKAAVEEGMLKV